MLDLLFGYVTNIDTNGRVRVKLTELDNYVTDYLPVTKSKSKNDKQGDFLEMDEEVAVIFDVEKQYGVVIGAINTDVSPLPISDRNKKYYTFADATHIEYDKAEHKAVANINGTADITTTKTVHNGDLYVNGNIICSQDVSDKKGTMQAMRDIYNPHKHGNGNNGVPTSTPDQSM